MSVGDLICGMNDRILGDKFNGGNFMFDPAKKEFWCVDNAKDPKLALSFKNEDSWKNWVVELMTLGEGVTDRGQGIGEHIHWALYTRKTEDTRELSQNIVLDPAAAGATAAGIDEAVADTLRSLQALAKDDTNGLPKTERDKLRSRLAFVDRRMKFAALLKFDPQFSEVPSAKNPWVGKKVGRLLTSAVVGRSTKRKRPRPGRPKRETARLQSGPGRAGRNHQHLPDKSSRRGSTRSQSAFCSPIRTSAAFFEREDCHSGGPAAGRQGLGRPGPVRRHGYQSYDGSVGDEASGA